MRELEILKRLQHPNILKFMGTTRSFGPPVALVAPWIFNGTLTSFLYKKNETLTLHDCLLLVRTLRNFLDCALELINNVLIGSDRTAYLADFGLSETLTRSPSMTYLAKMSRRPGAARWAAPEWLSVEESASEISTQSDIYCFGSIMLQVLTGNVPWLRLNNEFVIWLKVVEGEMHPRPDDCVTDQQWNFMTRCWSKTPIERSSAQEALQFVDSELALYD
ncbi:kinase-like domain-containing protein [Suillus paluster]|uniref:kinase-like domain-containing protein n=1 Tax=Suillus paluster TaxID=48578 RepID=UPI001B8850A2|nr:kinase-like domain-containing protein [Suillus paluster]KAG1735636.1 kinase-like domain-containing protein [Suillus paluster]